MFAYKSVSVSAARLSAKRMFHATARSLEVKEISSQAEFRESVLKSPIAFVDFYATWCGPCKMIAPYVEKFSETYKTVNFYKLDVDEVNDVARDYAISAMPTFMVFKHGKVVNKIVGANPQGIHGALVNATED
jgi:thioredoxin 1